MIAKLKQEELQRKRTNTQHEVSQMAMATSMRNQPRNLSKQPKIKPSGSGAIKPYPQSFVGTVTNQVTSNRPTKRSDTT